MHPAMVVRRNPFLEPVPAWLRNFKTYEPMTIVKVSPTVFKAPVRVDIMHRVVNWYRAGLRAGTASTKHRSDVRGTTRKMYQQKGTGRARAGTRRAHQRRGGARCFGPKPRKYSYELPRKIVNFGLRSALSTKFGQGQLSFVADDSILIDTHKTSSLSKIIANIPAKKILLIDSSPPQQNLKLAARSLNDSFSILNTRTDAINVYHILKYPCVLLTDRARKYYERYFNSSRY
ncbi:hypothetical protein PSACC_00730 [Paramicrosporidium saccamoebae]|uniref:Large ribosomal subunit protein uL4m n=1 Tax=Paramicrosporidium saccamoebae TaxID=1246581 RepID=A0A2H9TNX7_9FUNG|nr:hypothetical protein PSACC_00730 [Paramicrosporidium saccamoebae]